MVFDQLDSTNDEAKRRAVLGAPDGLVIWARQQHAGRGRLGRKWVSALGNLFISVLVKRNYALKRMAHLSFLASVAMRDALLDLNKLVQPLEFKWPNDLLLGGEKVCGHLLETVPVMSHENAVIIGTGVNVAHAPETGLYPTTSLAKMGGGNLSVESLIEAYLAHFQLWLTRWDQAGFGPVHESFMQHLSGKGSKIVAHLSDARKIDGIIWQMDMDGALVLRQEDGIFTKITAGDIFFTRDEMIGTGE